MKMNFKKSLSLFAVFVVTTMVISGTCSAKEKEVTSGTIKVKDQKECEFPGMASITLLDAVKAAQSSVKGKVLKAELENENGYLVYGIEIVAEDKSISNVKVDAGNGKVLLVEKDTEDSDEALSKNNDDKDEKEITSEDTEDSEKARSKGNEDDNDNDDEDGNGE